MAEFTWLVHPDIGIPWQCPTEAVGAWTVRGWETCDAPPEIDPTKERVAPEPAPEPPAEPEDEEPATFGDADEIHEGSE